MTEDDKKRVEEIKIITSKVAEVYGLLVMAKQEAYEARRHANSLETTVKNFEDDLQRCRAALDKALGGKVQQYANAG